MAKQTEFERGSQRLVDMVAEIQNCKLTGRKYPEVKMSVAIQLAKTLRENAPDGPTRGNIQHLIDNGLEVIL